MSSGPAKHSSPSSLPNVAPASSSSNFNPEQLATEDIELDDLDDHDLSQTTTTTTSTAVSGKIMAYRGSQGSGPGKLGEVANAVASCSALSFFSISMILANKVSGTSVCGQH